MTDALPTADEKSALNDYDYTNYARDGFMGPLTILTPEGAQLALEEVMEENRRNPLSEKSNRFKLHLFLPRVAAIAFHPTLVAAVRKALYPQWQPENCQQDSGPIPPPVLLWSSDINLKEPLSPGYFAPHQDSTYAGLEPATDCLTAWIALSDRVGIEKGCLSFYEGSHRWGQIEHIMCTRNAGSYANNDEVSRDDNNMLSLGQYISKERLEQENGLPPRAIPLRGGQATLHSFRCVHSSGPNRSKGGPRVGLALRFIAEHVRLTKPVREMATLISPTLNDDDDSKGIAERTTFHAHPSFDWEPHLTLPYSDKDEIEQGRYLREEAMRREEANYFQLQKVPGRS